MREDEIGHHWWVSVKQWIADWYRPSGVEDGLPIMDCTQAESRLGIVLPQPLKEWYTTAGRRTDIHCVQNRLLSPSQLEIHDNHVIFYLENQSVVAWGIALNDLGSPDPPVSVDLGYASHGRAHQWVEENRTVSEFLFQMVLHEALFASTFSGNAPIDQESIGEIEQHYTHLRFPDWHWPVHPTRFFGDRETLLVVNGAEWLWVAARNQYALMKVVARLSVKWAYLWEP
ncbi:MAG: hypothetical protein H0U76_27720 [Ktedonobacteraceae bacterium]|nr:hypothetical protein [Ktedonobacteraceae bacterium]